MKKFFTLSAIVLATLALTGCGTKTLNCTQKTTESGMDASATMAVKFKNNKPVNVKATASIDIGEEYASYLDIMKSSMESQWEEYKDEGAKVSVDTKGNSIIASIEIDVKKMSSDFKEEFDMTNLDSGYDAVKKDLESEGYTCK